MPNFELREKLMEVAFSRTSYREEFGMSYQQEVRCENVVRPAVMRVALYKHFYRAQRHKFPC